MRQRGRQVVSSLTLRPWGRDSRIHERRSKMAFYFRHFTYHRRTRRAEQPTAGVSPRPERRSRSSKRRAPKKERKPRVRAGTGEIKGPERPHRRLDQGSIMLDSGMAVLGGETSFSGPRSITSGTLDLGGETLMLDCLLLRRRRAGCRQRRDAGPQPVPSRLRRSRATIAGRLGRSSAALWLTEMRCRQNSPA